MASTLAYLTKVANKKSLYIPFDKLDRGTYPIKKATVYQSKGYDEGDRLCLFIQNGYIILPSRFAEVLKKKSVMDDLNSGKYAAQYKGKDKKTKRILLHIVANKKAAKNEKQQPKPKPKSKPKPKETPKREAEPEVELVEGENDEDEEDDDNDEAEEGENTAETEIPMEDY